MDKNMNNKGAFKLYKEASQKIPAYRDFLQSNDIKSGSIRSSKDFNKIPIENKKNYLLKYPRPELIWPDDLQGQTWYCSTSGSTGEPYYFARNEKLAYQASFMAEEFLKNSSYGNGRTLVLMGFGMGVWIGGVFTLRAFEIAAARVKTPVSFLPTGYNKKELFKALKMLSPDFEQTIIVGYPPFVKEIVDEADSEGINLKKLNLRFMFAAESFTDRFRDYICKKSGIENPFRDTLNIYGTADIGAMAHETPLSILIRRLALEDPLLYKDLFGQIEKTPTLAQFRPEFIHFESIDGEILITGNSAVPLIRFSVGDKGGVFSFDAVSNLFKRYGVDLAKEAANNNIGRIDRRPFVYVYERIDLAATIHGILIYPEFVKEGLLTNQMIASFTERFTMATKTDIHHNQFLQVNLELQKGIEPTDELEKRALLAIGQSLKSKSSEFAEISKSKLSSSLIKVVLWPNGHPKYFTPGIKQKWVEKT